MGRARNVQYAHSSSHHGITGNSWDSRYGHHSITEDSWDSSSSHHVTNRNKPEFTADITRSLAEVRNN